MTIIRVVPVLLAATLATATFAPATAKAASSGRAEIEHAIDAVYPALVRIHVVMEEGRDGRMQKMRASGSGTIISEDGYVLTNHHVAGRATRIVCRLSDREEVDAELVGTDPLSDLAVLKLKLETRRNPKAKLPVAKFGDSDKLKVGDVVLAMGSPSGLSQSVTKGVVANTEMIMPGGSGGMVLDGENVGELVRWIGHDAVIFHGNSGGPLVNLKGEIVGVNEIGIATMGGAIPSNLARAVAREIIAKGHVSRSWVGLEVQPLLKEMSKDKGVLVAAVLPDSPAKQAGIQAGDFITNYNGTPVGDARAAEDLPLFNRLTLSSPVGSQVLVKGVRDGQPMQWTLTTVEREPNIAREQELRNWGLTVRDFTRMALLENHRADRKGVLVDTVRAGGPCSEAKPQLVAGDIITKVDGTEITDVKSLVEWTRKFTQGLTEPKPVLITFERDLAQLVSVPKIGPEVEQDKAQRPAKAWLGLDVQVLTHDVAEALGLEGKKGVRVTMVGPDSPAAKAGIKAGDVFFKLDGQVIAANTPSDQELFGNLIRQMKPGTEIELAGQRGQEPLKLNVKLGETPKPASDLAEYKDELFEFSARDISHDDRVNDRLKRELTGVKISAVKNAGWAALAGLGSGDILLAVDGTGIESIAHLKTVMKDISERKPARVKFFVKHGIHTEFLELEPRW
jgi:serine protease Do